MGKMKIGIYCYLIVGILTKGFQKCLLNNLYQTYIYYVQTSYNAIACPGIAPTERMNFKNQLLRS